MTPTTRRYAGMSADDRATERRSRLLNAGLDVFADAGAKGATMTAICARAKLTERYFYESFSSRDELLRQVVDMVSDEIRVAALAALHSSDGTVETRVRQAITAFVTVLTDDPRKGRVAMIESLAVDSLRRYRRESLRDFARLVADQAHELYGSDAWPEPRSEINGLLFTGGLAELIIAWLNDEIDVTPQQIVESATYQFISTSHRPR
ncbi:helix-turn-helix domain-containing protein [Rhodococcus sp. Eu-32]|uniref:TetR/AcrR family transcriptional regulator n=1 Tax=Rhodococcus sp. Eu-32 TaxID=1017319 RepID=UPI001A9E86B9|nr:helix-turn-helix domain-containing protein [Rhodococcus sp. Eu-32]